MTAPDIWSTATAARQVFQDRGNPELTGLPEVLCQLLKVQEEAGEAAEAMLGVVGQNPRKGVTNGPDVVAEELVDVAVTAMHSLQLLLLHYGWSLKEAHTLVECKLAFINHRLATIT